MDATFQCECMNHHFWYFGDKVRCSMCYNEYKQVEENGTKKMLVRRFEREYNAYQLSWYDVPTSKD